MSTAPIETRVLIDPTPELLVATVGDLLPLAPYREAFRDAFRREVIGDPLMPFWEEYRAAPEDHSSWIWEPAFGLPLRFPETRLAWWTDHVGRRHLGVSVATQHGQLVSGPKYPPLSLLYPRVVKVLHRFGRARAVCFCECGTWGEPTDLAWMGPCCGPCQDRQADETFTPARLAVANTPVRGIAVASTGTVAVATPRALELWDSTTWQRTRDWGSGRLEDIALVFSRNGMHLWEVDTARSTVHSLNMATNWKMSSLAVAFAWNADALASFWPPDRLEWIPLWSEQRQTLPVPQRLNLRHLAVSPDDRLLAGISPGAIWLWNLEQRQFLGSIELAERGEPRGLAWSPVGTHLAVAFGDHVELWTNQRVTARLPLENLRGFAFHPDGQRLAVWNAETLRIFSIHGGAEEAEWALGQGLLAVCADGRLFAHATADEVRVWPGKAFWDVA